MSFRRKKEENEKKIVSTKDLYIALVGKIHSEIISEDSYIHRGEEGVCYTAVRKSDTEGNYIDIFNNTIYPFRDETSSYTILKVYPFSQDKEYTDIEHLKDIINAFDEIINDKEPKPADNKIYTRTRKK